MLILEELQIPDHNLPLERSVNISATQITVCFCFDTVFNLSNSVLTDLEFRLRLRFWRRILILLPFREKLINQSQNKILQIFVDACADCGFSEMNLHHTLVKFLLFLLSPTSKRSSQPAGIFKPIGK